jgi:hypothetical protein
MVRWPRKVVGYSPSEVQEYCVKDPEWQKCRLSMKGVPTVMKLDMLAAWISKRHNAIHAAIDRDDLYMSDPKVRAMYRRLEVQVSNYINALKRGGQLDQQLNVRK